MRARILAAALALCAAAVAGCGLGPGKDEGDVSLTVTRDYGSKVMLQKTDSIRESDTVIRVLDRNADITTRYGGRLRPVDRRARRWPERRPPQRLVLLRQRDRVADRLGRVRPLRRRPDLVGLPRLDRRDARAGGGRLVARAVPARLPGAPLAGDPRLPGRGSRPAKPPASVCRRLASPTSGPTADAIEVLVGTWNVVRTNRSAALLAEGPDQSGVFARFVGTRKPLLEVLNQEGQPAGSIGKGGGLIAALRPGDGPPTWVVTGTDAKGVAAAADCSAMRCGTTTRSRPSRARDRSGCRSRETRPRLHAGPQPASPRLAGRRDRLSRCAGGGRLHLLEPVGAGRRWAGHCAGRLCGRGAAEPSGPRCGSALPLLLFMVAGQRPGHPPGRHRPGAGLGDAGARQHRRHARVPGGGCGHRPQGGGGGSGVRRLLRLCRPGPRSPRPSPGRSTLGDDGGARHAHGPARRRRRRTPEGGGGAAGPGRRAGRAGRPGATPGRGLAGSRGRRGGHAGAARTLAGGAAADPARALARRCAADPDRRRDRARRGRGADRRRRGLRDLSADRAWTPMRSRSPSA